MSRDETNAEWENIMMESATYRRLIDEGWDEFWIEAWGEGWKEGWEKARRVEREKFFSNLFGILHITAKVVDTFFGVPLRNCPERAA